MNAGAVERVDWPAFLERFTWHQGEHVTMVGPTGSGKTTLALGIMERRSWVVALATKPKDATMDRLIRSGWRKAETWDRVPRTHLRKSLRVVLWPKYRTPDDEPMQRWEIGNAIRHAFTAGGWCIFADELWYLDKVLGHTKLLQAVWTQGRSIGVSLVGGTQRPAHVPLLAYDQATHLFLWRDNDETNLRRLSGLGGLNARLIRETVATLPKHDVLYLNTRTGQMLITRAPRK